MERASDDLIIPGFLRVEVVEQGSDVWKNQSLDEAVALSPDFDPKICCGDRNGTNVNLFGWEWR